MDASIGISCAAATVCANALPLAAHCRNGDGLEGTVGRCLTGNGKGVWERIYRHVSRSLKHLEEKGPDVGVPVQRQSICALRGWKQEVVPAD